MNTYLHDAVINNEIIDIKNERDLLLKNVSGETPFMLAAKYLDMYAMRSLYHQDVINEPDDEGRYPIYYIATRCKYIPFFKSIIDMGANLDIKDRYGNSGMDYIFENVTKYDTDIPYAHEKLRTRTFALLDKHVKSDLYDFLCRRRGLDR